MSVGWRALHYTTGKATVVSIAVHKSQTPRTKVQPRFFGRKEFGVGEERKKGKMKYSQHEEQKYDAGDFHMSDRVGDGVTFATPFVEEESAIDGPRGGEDGGCPVPEETTSNGEDEGGDTEHDDEEVEGQREGGVEGATTAANEVGEEEDGVEDCGKRRLNGERSC